MKMNLGKSWDDRPMVVIWEVTRACALACKHCRASAMRCPDPRELNKEWGARLIEQIAALGPMVFVLTGGDPMERRDVLDRAAQATDLGLRVALSPSATPLFLASDMQQIRDSGIQRISISLDGVTKEQHDHFRGVDGTWDWTMEAMQKVVDAGIELQINTTFAKHNVHDFEQMVDLVAQWNPSLWSVFQLVPTGRASMEDLLSGEEMEELFIKLHRKSLSLPFAIKTTEGQHYRRVVLQQNKKLGIKQNMPSMGISDGKGFVFISHTGDVYPSGFLPLSAGNIKQTDLGEIYRNSPLFRRLRDADALQGKCGYCEYRKICGGSRARAYTMTGDPMGEEPLCTYQPKKPIQPFQELLSHA